LYVYLRLIRFVKPHLWFFIGAVVCMGLSSLLSIAEMGTVPIILDRILSDQEITFIQKMPTWLEDAVVQLNGMDRIALLNIMVLVIPSLFFVKGFSIFGKGYLIARVSQGVSKDLQDQIYEKIQRLSLSFHGRQRTGELTSRITYDVSYIKDAVNENLSDLIFQSMQAFAFLLMVFFIHWRLALASFVLLPLIMVPVSFIARRIRKISSQQQSKMADIHSRLHETIGGIRIIKAFSMEDYELNKFKRETQRFVQITMKSIKRMVMIAPLTEFSGVLCGMVIIYFGGKDVLAGNISAGVFGSFVVYLLSLMKPLKKLARCHAVNQQVVSAGKRVFQILDEEIEIQEKAQAKDLAPIQKTITLENLSFSYDGKKPVLSNINCEFRFGEIIAFVGHSGVGKTTLVNLIPRFYDPTSGCVRIDGTDIRDVTLKSLRHQIGMVTQETVLFNDTIRANIAYGRIGMDQGAIEKAARGANAHDFILELSKGYDTMIGERGVRLSGGQRQRLSIARALLKNPPILILDEATSQLDTQSERLVQEAIEHLMADRTSLVIAHRLSTIQRATKIFVLKEGQIREVGTHQELMEKDGLYRKFYQLQAEGAASA
jgi:ATP-binding cassette, subfamily B, bacterial MsbA